jgi:hypothetical protein
VVSPAFRDEIVDLAQDPLRQITITQRPFEPADLDGVWLVVAAATPEVNRQVAEVAETRRVFVNAVDDPANASAFLSGVVRRDGVTLAISTSGQAPALVALLREGSICCCRAIWPRGSNRRAPSGSSMPRRRADGTRKPKPPRALNARRRAADELVGTSARAPGQLIAWAAGAVLGVDWRIRGCNGTCLARWCGPGRSRAVDAPGHRAAACRRPRAVRRAD